MRINKLSLILRLILPSLFILALSGCETIQIAARNPFTPNGTLSLGCTQANTISSGTIQLSEDDCIAAIQEKLDVTNPDGSVTKGHAPAVIQSADDYETETVELDQACRLLGNNCSYALAQTVRTRQAILMRLRSGSFRVESQSRLSLP